MTHAEFNEYFKKEVLPLVIARYEQDGIKDIPARCEAYNNEMDHLFKDGQITEKQVNNWCIPDSLIKRKKVS